MESLGSKGGHMDWNQVEGNWKQVKGKIKEQWGKLSDETMISGQGDLEERCHQV